MKLKKLKEMFAWAAFGFVFANMSIVAKAEELPDENAVVSDQDDSAETDAEDPSGPSNFAEAKENLENAKKEEEKAKAEVDNAQLEFDNAQSDMNQAELDAADAASSLEQAQIGKEDAEAAKENAEQSVSETGQALKDAEETLDQVLEEANINEDDYNSACEELEKKETEVEEAKQTVAEAEDEQADKQGELEEAEEETKKAEEVLESAKQEKEDADQAVSDAQANVDSAQKEYEEALDAPVIDITENAKKDMEAAKEALEKIEEKVASGSLGYFQTLAQEGSVSAQAAVTILTAQNQEEVPGLRNGGWSADSWQEFISYTHIGEANDATNLENVKKTFDYIEECNSLRTTDNNFPGCADLLVNDALMAVAQLNANWAANVIGHSSVFNVGENLAWYSNGSDPFRGWYDREKAYYEEGNTAWDHSNGHYLNITKKSYYATGYGINTYTQVSYPGNYAHAQEFDFEEAAYGESYSVSEYKERFMNYYDTVMAELKSAQETYDAAKAAYDKALAGGTSDGNQEYIANKKAALDKAVEALKTAEAEAEMKVETLKSAQEAYDAAIENQEAIRDEYVQMGEDLANLKNDLQQKQDEYESLLNSINETFTPETVEAMQNLKEAKNAHEKALSDLKKAEEGLSEAETVLAAAIETKAAADQNISEKEDVLSEKQQILTDAQNKHYRALADLAIAQADYDRLKPAPVVSRPVTGHGNNIATEPVYDTPAVTVQVDNSASIIEPQSEYGVSARTRINDLQGSNNRQVSFNGRYHFKAFLDTFADVVRKCPYQNLVIDCSNQPWFSLNKKTLEALGDGANKINKSLTVVFRYLGKKYTFTIPAGYDLSLLQDSNGWYGFMYLKMVFGGHEIV